MRCHGEKKIESGIRWIDSTVVSRIAGCRCGKGFGTRWLTRRCRPRTTRELSVEEREVMDSWIAEALAVARTRVRDKNGTVRRLPGRPVPQHAPDLMGFEDELADVLPADSVSAEGFLNNGESMVLSPLLIEAYFDIAEKALDLAIVDESVKPVIQTFRVELGDQINPKPFKDKLILGALSRLLRNRTSLSRNRSKEAVRLRAVRDADQIPVHRGVPGERHGPGVGANTTASTTMSSPASAALTVIPRGWLTSRPTMA
ncbi:MAG: hypothetical protein Ct9H300mP1_16500 [Planctomycetaceae bacterium]|nr:MAG: hypothetical protein Ct9H300mP1_16500 [Planctomycetaceae bacterium]